MSNKILYQTGTANALLTPVPTSQSRTIFLTVFPNVRAQTMESISTTLSGLAGRIRNTRAHGKAELPLLSGARYGAQRTEKGSLRYDANVMGVSAAIGDYDGGKVSLAETQTRLRSAGIEAIIYPTPSFTPEKPRWRVLAFFSQELPPNLYQLMQDHLNSALGGILAPESRVLSQSFYFGFIDGALPEVDFIEGTPIDLLCKLDTSSIGRLEGGHTGKACATQPDDGVLKSTPSSIFTGRRSKLNRRAMRSAISFDEVAAAVASIPDGRTDHPLRTGDMWRRWFLFPLADFAARNPETADATRELFLRETRRIADPGAVAAYAKGAKAYFTDAEARFDNEVAARRHQR